MTSLSPVIRRSLAGFLLVLPLIIGASYSYFADIDPADTWSQGGERSGAPAATVDDSALVDARRATGEASSQAGFLVTGTEELVAGTGELNSRSGEVVTGVTSAVDAAQQLADGMVQLQAATGEMGDGAVKIADNVQFAVDQIVGFEAARGQILGTLDRHIEDLKTAKDADSIKLREELIGFRDQAATFQIDENMKANLEELKNGSRELANQLDVPGYAFHDGIYAATTGSRQLSDGLNELNAGVDEALAGISDLEQGAVKVDDMANRTKDRISTVQRAIPVTQAGTPEAELAGVSHTLAPMYAFLIAAAVLLGASMRMRDKPWMLGLVIAGLALIAAVLTAVLGVGVSAGEVFGVFVIAALTAAATVLGGILLLRLFGPIWGQVLVFGGAIMQIALVGVAWNKTTTSSGEGIWSVISALLPVHYSTSAISALGNSAGAGSVVALAVVVLAALCAVVFGGLRLIGPSATEAE